MVEAEEEGGRGGGGGALRGLCDGLRGGERRRWAMAVAVNGGVKKREGEGRLR